VAIVAQSGNVAATSAAVEARAYRGPNNLSDWYLPSQDELNQMCKWVNAVAWTSDATVCTGGTLNLGTGAGLGAAGFVADIYWTSSDNDADHARAQFFTDGVQGRDGKVFTNYVRPVRAF
jgi:hypothetical protein